MMFGNLQKVYLSQCCALDRGVRLPLYHVLFDMTFIVGLGLGYNFFFFFLFLHVESTLSLLFCFTIFD